MSSARGCHDPIVVQQPPVPILHRTSMARPTSSRPCARTDSRPVPAELGDRSRWGALGSDDQRCEPRGVDANGLAAHHATDWFGVTTDDSPMAPRVLSMMGAFAVFERSLTGAPLL